MVSSDLCARVLDELNDAVFLTSADGSVLYINQRASLLAQCTAESAIGRNIAETLSLLDANGDLLIDWSAEWTPESGFARLMNHYHAELPVLFSRNRLAGNGPWIVTFTMIPPIDVLPAPVQVPAALDVLDTGPAELGSREGAEQAIRDCVDQGLRKFAILLVAERLKLYRNRYGPAAAQSLKSTYARHLARTLQQGDEFYDWSPTRVLVLAERDAEGSLHIKQEIQRVATRRIECPLKDDSGIVSLQSDWTIVPMFGDDSPEDLIAQLNQFATNS